MDQTTPPKESPPARRPRRPANLPYGSWLGDFEGLTKPEEALVDACKRGEWCELNDGERPEASQPACTIRAGLVRFLLLGGDAEHPVHSAGVRLLGAWIGGDLDLTAISTPLELWLWNCRIAEPIVARSASIGSLGLQGCQIADLKGDGIKVNGGVFLRNGFAATGEVRLLGAEIGGDLDCSGGLFSNTDGDALNADRVKVTGSVFLRDGFAATDEVRLLGAEIGGSLYCTGGKFINADGKALSADGIRVTGDVFLREGFAATGEVRLLGAEIGGALDCSDGNFTNACRRAINGDGCRVINGLLLRGAHVTGAIDLAAASVGTLVDHGFDWHGGGHFLDGFAYDQLVGTTDGHQRIAWLRSQQKDQLDHRNFKPQPWEQLIAVLRAMGHPHEATKVAIAKQDQMRKAGKIGKPGSLWQWPENVFHILFRVLAGYGHRPAWTVVWLIGVWIVSSFAFYAGRDAGFFGPSSAVIEMSALHQACGAPGDRQPGSLDPRHPGHLLPGPPKAHWTSPACPLPPEYTTLQPALYSLDLILPVINLQQDGDWAPIVARSDGSPLFWGHALRGLVWFEILFGWITSLMLAAVVANLVRKD